MLTVVSQLFGVFHCRVCSDCKRFLQLVFLLSCTILSCPGRPAVEITRVVTINDDEVEIPRNLAYVNPPVEHDVGLKCREEISSILPKGKPWSSIPRRQVAAEQ